MKKNLLLVIAITVLTSTLQAQINKGALFLGGTVGFSNTVSDSSSNKDNSFTFSPAVGIAVRQNLVAGIQLTFSSDKNNLYQYSSESKYYGAALFLRKYVPLGKGFYVYVQPNVYYYGSKYTYENPSPGNYSHTWSVGLNGVGVGG